MVDNCLNFIQRYILRPCFKGQCLLCHAPLAWGSDFCSGCIQDLAPLPSVRCHCCASTLSGTARQALLCGQCQQQAPSFCYTRAAWCYAAPLDSLILALKFHQQLHLARALAELMLLGLDKQELLPAANEVDVLMPIPLHRSRLAQRGYNQALELARPLARKLHLPVDFTSLKRWRPTPAQMDLPLQQRQHNVRDAFRLSAKAEAQASVIDKRIALIDDVMTSGHTANAAAHCLRQAGAREVQIWVLART